MLNNWLPRRTATPPGHPSPAGRVYSRSILQALLVTFLWSTSWVLIKLGLRASLPAVTFAGLRYMLAFVCLLPFVLLNPTYRRGLKGISRAAWVQLMVLGLVLYTLTQGLQFITLDLLPAATLTLLLNFSPVVVALFSGALNHEPPSLSQWGGIALSMSGAAVYFLPWDVPAGRLLGLILALAGVLSNAAAALLGRRVNHGSGLPPMLVTTISMGMGGLLLLAIGVGVQGMGALGLQQWLIIGWLAVVNTALAFTLWNHTLRTLTAVQSSVINNTMLPQIALLAWLFLDEPLTSRQLWGLALVVVGTLVVQLGGRRPA